MIFFSLSIYIGYVYHLFFILILHLNFNFFPICPPLNNIYFLSLYKNQSSLTEYCLFSKSVQKLIQSKINGPPKRNFKINYKSPNLRKHPLDYLCGSPLIYIHIWERTHITSIYKHNLTVHLQTLHNLFFQIS